MANIVWAISSINTVPQIGQYTDFVTRIEWMCSALNGANVASQNGVVNFNPAQQAGEYTPASDLTQNEMLVWVKLAIGEQSVKNIEYVLTQQVI